MTEQRGSTVVLIPWQISTMLDDKERAAVVEFNSNWYSIAVVELRDGQSIVFKKNGNGWERKSVIMK